MDQARWLRFQRARENPDPANADALALSLGVIPYSYRGYTNTGVYAQGDPAIAVQSAAPTIGGAGTDGALIWATTPAKMYRCGSEGWQVCETKHPGVAGNVKGALLRRDVQAASEASGPPLVNPIEMRCAKDAANGAAVGQLVYTGAVTALALADSTGTISTDFAVSNTGAVTRLGTGALADGLTQLIVAATNANGTLYSPLDIYITRPSTMTAPQMRTIAAPGLSIAGRQAWGAVDGPAVQFRVLGQYAADRHPVPLLPQWLDRLQPGLLQHLDQREAQPRSQSGRARRQSCQRPPPPAWWLNAPKCLAVRQDERLDRRPALPERHGGHRSRARSQSAAAGFEFRHSATSIAKPCLARRRRPATRLQGTRERRSPGRLRLPGVLGCRYRLVGAGHPAPADERRWFSPLAGRAPYSAVGGIVPRMEMWGGQGRLALRHARWQRMARQTMSLDYRANHAGWGDAVRWMDAPVAVQGQASIGMSPSTRRRHRDGKMKRTLSILALAAALPSCGSAADRPVVPSRLAEALAKAKPGDTITLAPGDYGDVVLPRVDNPKAVTVDASQARLRSLTVRQTSGWTWRPGGSSTARCPRRNPSMSRSTTPSASRSPRSR